MKKFRIGNGYDVHALAKGLTMTLGGVTIKHNVGFVAHSDGDVLIHALCDALLGGASLGDIGLHFPDNDEYYKGIDSKILLSKTCQKIREAGFEVENVDCTILAQAPRLRPYIELMRATLSQVMQIPTEDVSIKATTTEHLGFVGRQEGVAVYCVALLSK